MDVYILIHRLELQLKQKRGVQIVGDVQMFDIEMHCKKCQIIFDGIMEIDYIESTSQSNENDGLVKSLLNVGETVLAVGFIAATALALSPITYLIERKIRKELRPEIEAQYGRKLSNGEYGQIMDERDAAFWHSF